MQLFKIKMLESAVLVNYSRAHMFHKGRTYCATRATNQPNWKKDGKIFVIKEVRIPTYVNHAGDKIRGFSFRHSMLLQKGDYVKV
jgi:hypothetical protein